ncbi:hypothetical protein [Arthrobacter sp. HMWF013]|uniref:hypothetical protein n=1 Tax=Arthrobacter sp. HMWF013 TaxID=2056849 RepID=UPI000D369065|nr:hypothetical protein [Arthrobacter sp. HMWF013]PTT67714.1 hypothetical protein DBR22_08275 [Arthrobacter sp. HMWF013]
MERWPDSKNARPAIAAWLAAAASVALLVLPVYTEVELSAGEPGQARHSTLLESVGPSLFLPLLIPIVVTASPLLLHGSARTTVSVMATVGLAVFVVIGSASIGWFYLPALAAAVAAVVASTGAGLAASGDQRVSGAASPPTT